MGGSCDDCGRPKAGDELWRHPSGCKCDECVAHCWGSGSACRPTPRAELRATIARLTRERDEARERGDMLSQCAHELVRQRDEARANYQFMVDRAADDKLDGYRELGARAAAAENALDDMRRERDEARAEVERLQEALVWMSGAPSFAPDGEARAGFETLVAPLLRAIKPADAISRGEHRK